MASKIPLKALFTGAAATALAEFASGDTIDKAFLDPTLVDTSAAQVLGGKTLTSPKETRTAPAISAGTLTLDLSGSSVFDVSLNGNITTLTISNVAASGTAHGFVLTFTADGTARSIVWPASFTWMTDAGVAPTLTSTSGKKISIVGMTTDGGTTWLVWKAGQNA